MAEKDKKDTPATDEVADKLKSFGVDDDVVAKIKDQLGATSVASLEMLTETDLVGVGMKPLQARTLLVSLAPTVPDASVMNMANLDMLPAVPDDASWLAALRTGGVLKVDQSTVISAVRAALASRVGLYGIPDKLAALMEQFADTNDEPVDSDYFRLRKQLTRRNYSEVFEAIDGLDGTFVTEARKKELFKRIETHLWPAVLSFDVQLREWVTTWHANGGGPMVQAFSELAKAIASSKGLGMGAGTIQPPPTGTLRDHALAVNDAINRIFAGTGAQIAAAVAYEAGEIRKSLENPRLPALIGVANRDQMLKALGVSVSATYPRMEQSLTRYVLSIMQVENQPAGVEELAFFEALWALSSQMSWDQVGGNTGGRSMTGVGGTRL